MAAADAPSTPPPGAGPASAGPKPAESPRKENRKSGKSLAVPPPKILHAGSTGRARNQTRSSSTAARKALRPHAAATLPPHPPPGTAMARPAVYRTRCRGTAPCRRASAGRRRAAGFPRPTGFGRGTAGPPAAARTAAGKRFGLWSTVITRGALRRIWPAAAPACGGSPRRTPGRPARTPRNFRSSWESCRYRSASPGAPVSPPLPGALPRT